MLGNAHHAHLVTATLLFREDVLYELHTRPCHLALIRGVLPCYSRGFYPPNGVEGGVTAQDYSVILFITDEAKLTNMYHHGTKRRADFADVLWPSSTVARTADNYSGGPTVNTAW